MLNAILFVVVSSSLFSCGVAGWMGGHSFGVAIPQEEEQAEILANALAAIAKAAADPDQKLQTAAFRAMEVIDSDSPIVVEAVKKGLLDSTAAVRKAALRVLHNQKWKDSIKGGILIEMLRSDDETIRREALAAFDTTYQQEVMDDLLGILQSDDQSAETKLLVLNALAQNVSSADKIMPVLERIYPDASQSLKLQILATLSSYGSSARPALRFVTEQANSKYQLIRLAAIGCLRSVLANKDRLRAQPRRRTVTRSTSSARQRAAIYVDSVFKKFDRNSDGVLDATERKELRVKFTDSNKDGKISRNEALEFVGGR